MSGTYRHGRVYCQMADCRNRATRLVKVELPATWSGANEYTARTLLVGVCGDCGRDLESRARALLGARAEFGRLLRKAAKASDLQHRHIEGLRLLVELLKAIGPPFEPEQGSVYARWITRLDPQRAQQAWRLLIDVKREADSARRRMRAAAVLDDGSGDPAA